MSGIGPSVTHLQARLGKVEARVRSLVAARRSTDPNPDDAFRGLYVSDDQVDRMLDLDGERLVPQGIDAEPAGIEEWADAEEARGCDLRLRRLCRSFGLDGWDLEILLVSLAPDLDSRFERLYGYLNDDVSRRRACIGLAMELCGMGLMLDRFHARSPLRSGGLLLVEETDRPLLTRPLRVPDRLIAHLLGDDRPDASIAPLLAEWLPVAPEGMDVACRALDSGAELIYLRERSGAAGVDPWVLRLWRGPGGPRWRSICCSSTRPRICRS